MPSLKKLLAGRERELAATAAGILRLMFRTWRLQFNDRPGLCSGGIPTPVIMCFWHDGILSVARTFFTEYPADRRGVHVLTSPSRDGEILARLMNNLGMGAVRGSTSRRGSQALLELVTLVESGADIAITPDGPRGPRHTLGPGAILLAQLTGAPILPVHASASPAKTLKTWDRFIIPLPFARISVTVDPPVFIPRELSAEDFESHRRNLENHLNHGAN